MAMGAATRGLVGRALKLREAAARGALAAAEATHARRVAEVEALREGVAREPEVEAGLVAVASAWRRAAAARLAAAGHAAREAEAACGPAREALAAQVRLRRGLEELDARAAAEAARKAARRDPVPALAALGAHRRGVG